MIITCEISPLKEFNKDLYTRMLKSFSQTGTLGEYFFFKNGDLA